MKILIQGACNSDQVPGIDALSTDFELSYAADKDSMLKELPDAEVLLAWNFRSTELQECWHKTSNLKWIHWCGAGIDAALFNELRSSDIILTNARGIFDRAMAETVLGYMLMVAKDFKTTINNQRQKIWQYRMTRKLRGDKVLIIGVGSIGREFARLLNANGLMCYGAGRSARNGDEDFMEIYASDEVSKIINNFNWVIGVMPATVDTQDFFNAEFFSSMNPDAYFINMGRGVSVVENDIISALKSRQIAGAMLDVFCNEPLDDSNSLWEIENLFISPHMSGDYVGFEDDMVELFKNNLDKYLSGEPLMNIVDKQLGFVKNI